MIDCSTGHTVNNAAPSGQDKNCTSFLASGVTSLTPISSSKPTQISVWRRRRKERGEMSPLCDRTGSSFLENTSNSPKKTPTKSLPFTPSRVNEVFFFYSWSTLLKLIPLRVDGMMLYLVMWRSLSVYPPPRFATYQELNTSAWTPLHSPLLLFVAKGVSSTHHSTKRPHPSTRKRTTGKKASQKSITLRSMRILM